MTSLKFVLMVALLSLALGTVVEGQEVKVKDPDEIVDFIVPEPAGVKPATTLKDVNPAPIKPTVEEKPTTALKDAAPITARKNAGAKPEDPILEETASTDSQRRISKRDSGDEEDAPAPRRRNKNRNAADREAIEEDETDFAEDDADAPREATLTAKDAGDATDRAAGAAPVQRRAVRNAGSGVPSLRSEGHHDGHHHDPDFDPYLGTWPLSVERRVLGWVVVALLVLIAIMLLILVALIFRLRLCLECLCCKLKGSFNSH